MELSTDEFLAITLLLLSDFVPRQYIERREMRWVNSREILFEERNGRTRKLRLEVTLSTLSNMTRKGLKFFSKSLN